MNSKTKGLTLLFVVLVVIYIFVDFSEQDTNTDSAEAQALPTEVVSTVPQEITMQGNGDIFKDTTNFADCESSLDIVRKSKSNWARENNGSWVKYIGDGYSLNDVTLAFEFFLNSNFSANFRINYLRQKRKTLAETDILIDDIALVMLDESFPDSDILLMMDQVSDLSQAVTHGRYETVSLLDIAIISGRPSIVEALLNYGLDPNHDEYLGSSMEWALMSLFNANEDKEAVFVDIIFQLLNHNATARFSNKNEKLVKGRFPRWFYEFDEKWLKHLLNEYNLDLTNINSKPQLIPDKNHPLIRDLIAQRQQFLTQNLNKPDVDSAIEQCGDTLDRVYNQWKPRNLKDVIEKIVKQEKNDEEKVIERLSMIDPHAVDYYRKYYIVQSRKTSVGDDVHSRINESFKMFQNGKVQQAIAYLLDTDIDESRQSWFLMRALNAGYEYVDEILNSPLAHNLDDYGLLDAIDGYTPTFITQLSAAGINVDKADVLHKTLLFYAAQRRNSVFIEFLHDNKYTFNFDEHGEDPLHAALTVETRLHSFSEIEATIDSLMKFQPTIDEFHLRRMALINLFYPSFYDRIVGKYPNLAIEEGIKLPEVYKSFKL